MAGNQQEMVDRTRQIMNETGVTWKMAWLQAKSERRAESAAVTPADVEARTRQLMAEGGIGWRKAWTIASAERGVPLPERTVSIWGTALAVAAGLAFIAVPTILSQLLWPGWLVASGDEQDVGFLGWSVFIGLSGLCIVAAGVWFGASANEKRGLRIFLRMYVGVVIATWVSVIAMAPGAYDVGFAAAMFAMMIGIPFWFFAGFGLAMGSIALRVRRQGT